MIMDANNDPDDDAATEDADNNHDNYLSDLLIVHQSTYNTRSSLHIRVCTTNIQVCMGACILFLCSSIMK